jgi:hypothetical protein
MEKVPLLTWSAAGFERVILLLTFNVPRLSSCALKVRWPPLPGLTLIVPVLTRVPVRTIRLTEKAWSRLSSRREPALVKPTAAVTVVLPAELSARSQTLCPAATLPDRFEVPARMKLAAPAELGPRLSVELRRNGTTPVTVPPLKLKVTAVASREPAPEIVPLFWLKTWP